MSNLTLEDIAKLSGVSRSTVSRVVNDHPNVSQDVRQRVLQVIKQTGYHPNAAARSLASARSGMLGLVLPRSFSALFADPYFPRLTQGIAQACNQHDYTLGLFLLNTKEEEEKIFPQISRPGLLEGVLVQAGQIGEQLISRLVNSNMPLMIAGRPFETNQVSYIDIDNVAAAHSAVSHLLRLGYRRIATIQGLEKSTVTVDRLEGYRKALRERGLETDETLIASGDFTETSGYYAMQQLMPVQPEAVFVASDQMAVGAMRALRDAGLRIPDDVAIVGFDDLPVAKTATPPLTTVRQPIAQLGVQAVEILIDLIENGISPHRRVILDTELVIRESCGALRRVAN